MTAQLNTPVKHSADEALNRFKLVHGSGDPNANTACAMTCLAWMNGEAFTDSMACAHPILRLNVIKANDTATATHEQRAELVRAGEQGVIDTWWIPDEVIVSALAAPKPEPGTEPAIPGHYDRTLNAIRKVADWKTAATKERPDLRGAVLSGAVLSGAVLRGAVLSGAVLSGAVLSGADLSDADLSGAVLRGAVLRGADLRGADLRDAVLSDAVLSDAVLRGAVLRGAVLRGAVLSGAVLRGAVLSAAVLSGADLRDAWQSTTWPAIWPAGFDHAKAGVKTI